MMTPTISWPVVSSFTTFPLFVFLLERVRQIALRMLFGSSVERWGEIDKNSNESIKWYDSGCSNNNQEQSKKS